MENAWGAARSGAKSYQRKEWQETGVFPKARELLGNCDGEGPFPREREAGRTRGRSTRRPGTPRIAERARKGSRGKEKRKLGVTTGKSCWWRKTRTQWARFVWEPREVFEGDKTETGGGAAIGKR